MAIGMGDREKKDILHEPAYVIAFITALFYVCIYGYLSSYNAKFDIPLCLRDVSFFSLLANGFWVAQLVTIFLIMAFPIILIYKYPSRLTYVIIIIPFIMIFILKLVNAELINWIDGMLLFSFVFTFAFYMVMLLSSRFENSIIKIIKWVGVKITPHHVYYILIMIIFLVIILSTYLGDRSAQQDTLNDNEQFRINIIPKDQNLTALNTTFLFVTYTNGNYILKDIEENSSRQEIYIIPNSEIKMATLRKIHHI